MRRLYSILSCLLAAMLGFSAPAACCCAAFASAPPSPREGDACCKAAPQHDDAQHRVCHTNPDAGSCCDKPHRENDQPTRPKKDGCCKINSPCRDDDRPTHVAAKAARLAHPDHDFLFLAAAQPTFAWPEPTPSPHLSVASPPMDRAPDASLLNLGCLLTI